MKTDLKKFKTLNISQLVKADWNYKENNDELKEKLKENIKRNGQVENIIVRLLDTGFYEVVNGNHRYEAMKELEFENIIVCDITPCNINQAKRLAIETNETKFNTDNIKLAEIFKEISTEFSIEDLEKTNPYTNEDLEDFINIKNFDYSDYQIDMNNNDKSISNITIQFENEEDKNNAKQTIKETLEANLYKFKIK